MNICNSKGSEWRKWDLHLHSTASDGKCTPQELINAAIDKNISVIAITDHHTVDNLNEIKQLGKEKGITVISGIEFRTDYGQKSVHMIGLFPDYYQGTKLDESALNDLVLSQLGLSRTKIVALGKKANSKLSEDKAYKEGLLKAYVNFKTAADLIHQYGGLVSVHAGSKSNSFDEEMKHEGSGPKNVSPIDSLGLLKEELLEKYIDICEVRNQKEAEFYIKNYKKPVIAASDAHNINDFARNYVWIKGDTSFEGLKQIIYEPEDRVAIQKEKPDSKSDYLVIESLDIDHPEFGKQMIPFNPGLNTIIGGRSSGKSILLGCIAKLCGNETPVKSREEYNEYIEKLTKNMRLTWRDHETSTARKIDFFPQSHIIELASNESKIAGLVEELLRSSPDIEKKISELKAFSTIHPSKIHRLFAQLEAKLVSSNIIKEELAVLGNKQGVEREIKKIESILDDIKNSMGISLTEDESLYFESAKKQLEELKKTKEEIKQIISSLADVKSLPIISNYDFSGYGFDHLLTSKIISIFKILSAQFQSNWSTEIQSLIEEQYSSIKNIDIQIRSIEENSRFWAIKEAYDKSLEYKKIDNRLTEEKNRFGSIMQKEREIESVQNDILQLKKEILAEHSLYYKKNEEYSKNISLEKSDIVIKPEVKFVYSLYQNFIDKNFDGRASCYSELYNKQFKNNEEYVNFIELFFNNLLQGTYSIKAGKAVFRIAEELIASNFYNIKYNIIYQGDELQSMSEGKIAFVILRLLLDFSNNDYPILIDQPEDDLDNRAIYFELVKYLRDKKKQRQIILVTHNPNIVVGADAEEIIVANQNGVNNKNPDNVRFAFYSGALENSFLNDMPEILLSKGIRQHVCEILEGGEQAFKERENKYQL